MIDFGQPHAFAEVPERAGYVAKLPIPSPGRRADSKHSNPTPRSARPFKCPFAGRQRLFVLQPPAMESGAVSNSFYDVKSGRRSGASYKNRRGPTAQFLGCIQVAYAHALHRQHHLRRGDRRFRTCSARQFEGVLS